LARIGGALGAEPTALATDLALLRVPCLLLFVSLGSVHNRAVRL